MRVVDCRAHLLVHVDCKALLTRVLIAEMLVLFETAAGYAIFKVNWWYLICLYA